MMSDEPKEDPAQLYTPEAGSEQEGKRGRSEFEALEHRNGIHIDLYSSLQRGSS